MTHDDRLMLQAMLDGELDALTQHGFERRLAAEPELAAAFGRLRALRGAMRGLPPSRAPESLRRRIDDLTGGPAVRAVPMAGAPRASWGAIAATVAALFVGGAGGWFGATTQGPGPDENLVASHVRGLVAARPVDVASSDQHTVRPWFAGKLSRAPVVVDLASAGFPLEGGRIDMVDGEPEPTLVYRRGPHVISVTRLPASARPAGLETRRTVSGHSVLSWQSGGARYVAVSDASPAELDVLRTAFDKAAGGA